MEYIENLAEKPIQDYIFNGKKLGNNGQEKTTEGMEKLMTILGKCSNSTELWLEGDGLLNGDFLKVLVKTCPQLKKLASNLVSS